MRQRKANFKEVTSSEERKASFIIVSNNNACRRFSFDLGLYEEELDIKGADFSELKTMFIDHEPSALNAIARVENVREEAGELVCDCVFGSDAKSAEIFKKYEEGILSDVSIGYQVLSEELDKEAKPIKSYVKAFKIFELSAVWKGADKFAKKREEEQNDLKKARFQYDFRANALKIKALELKHINTKG